MSTKPAQIHLKSKSHPYVQHVPIPIPFHWKEKVKQSLDKDVANNIIEPVPIHEPVRWCSKMAVVPKKDRRPRRAIDFQHLISQCQCKTHHCQSPFNLDCQIPLNEKKQSLMQWMATMPFHLTKLANH